LLEAMACKTPIIATEVGNIPNIIKNMKSGLLVKPGDKNALRAAIILLDMNKKLGNYLASNAIHEVKKYRRDKITCPYFGET
jgi:glycosyltransferase involved in cell wall biosynthesis